MLRTSLYRRVILIALGSSVLVAAGLCFFGESYFRTMLRTSIEESFEDISRHTEFMSRVLEVPEAEMFRRGSSALMSLNARYGDGAALARLDPASLARLAASLDVNDIYVIDGDGKVAASSLPGDIGLDLTSFNKRFTAFLEGMRGSGKVENQALSVSTREGAIATYQYFSPPGSRLIFEVSIDLADSFPRSYPGMNYAEFIELGFGSFKNLKPNNPIVSIDIIHYSAQCSWSLLWPGTRKEIDKSIVLAAFRDGEKLISKGNLEYHYRPVDTGEENGRGLANRKVCEIVVDRSPLIRFLILTVAMAILACAIVGLLSLILTRRFFDRAFLVRVESLQAAMTKVAEGEREFEFESEGNDELAIIGKGIEAMLRDVRTTEESLRNAKLTEAMGIMAGGLAHDINNLLAGAVGAASLLKSRLDEEGSVPPEELRTSLELIENTGKKGEILVRDLLALARLDRPRNSVVDLAAIVREMAELIRASVPSQVRLETRLPSGEALALGSAEDIERILINLCKNGIQAMTTMLPPERDKGGRLTIALAHAEKGFWSIEVRDEGLGMSPEIQARLFTPFFTTKSRRGGSGLGLAASKAMAESMGGRMEVSSEEGKGSVFTLFLPATQAKLEEALVTREAGA